MKIRDEYYAENLAFWHGIPVPFDTVHEVPGHPGCFEGRYGIVLPDGEIYLETVLSDGSLGWGEWTEPSTHYNLIWENWRKEDEGKRA